MQQLRQQIIDAMRNALEPLDYVNALWLGGSTAMGGEDELSDIDAVLDVDDGRVDDAFAVVEEALEKNVAPIEIKWVVPEPSWHGHSQRFYRLKGSPEYLLIDLVVMQRNSSAMRFDEREIHGEPQVIFDKLGIVRSVPLDKEQHRETIRKRIEQLRPRFELLKHFPAKELSRGLTLDALWRYDTFVLLPLIELLRTRYKPVHNSFGTRYLKRDLPPDVYVRLMELKLIRSAEELAVKIPQAIEWAEDELAALNVDQLEV
jgi:hypothetical protein